MARRGNPDRAAGLIRRLVEIGVEVLARDLGLERTKAEAAMRETAHDLAKEYGGQYIYVSQDHEFELTKRDMRLWEAFDGNNVPQLAVQFALSEVQVRYIIKHMRRLQARKNQSTLPGFEPPADPC